MLGDQKITRHNFLSKDGFTFSFAMTNHLNPQFSEDKSLMWICATISSGYQRDVPIWTRLLGGQHILLISPSDVLYQHLEDCREGALKFLVFKKESTSITVVHFGSFVNERADQVKSIFESTNRSLSVLRKIWDELKLAENEKYVTVGEQEEVEEEQNKEKQEKCNREEELEGEIKRNLVQKFWAAVQTIEAEMECKKDELKDFSYHVYNKPEEKAAAERAAKMLSASTGKAVVKGVTAVLFTELAEEIAKKIAGSVTVKTAAKAAAKTSSSGASKMTAKAVPIFGLAVGTAFGIWRFCKGDMTGAGLEVAAGVAACVPGTGTAASLAIDAGLVARDIYDASNEKENLSVRIKKIEEELNQLFEKYDVALAEYEFATNILEDPGFSTEKIQREIDVLERVSTALRSI